jgi:hypothetical protein
VRLPERGVWIASWVAPAAGWAALLVLGLFVAWPRARLAASSGGFHAWLIAGLVLAWLIAHLAVRFHGTAWGGFSRDERAELKWKLNVGRGYAHWRELMRRRGAHWYGGRSHSGERPRFD